MEEDFDRDDRERFLCGSGKIKLKEWSQYLGKTSSGKEPEKNFLLQ